MNKKLAIFGYGGHAREVAQALVEDVTFFVDDDYANDVVLPISKFDVDKYHIIVAVADSKDRMDIVNRLPKETKYFTFIHPTALIMDKNIKIGEGSYIGPYSILTTNIELGKHTILNRGNHIGHDTKIGDYFSAMPGAIVSGNVLIDDYVYLGTNSSIREKITICKSVTIGLSSGVVKSIYEPGVYAGSPAKQIK